MFLKRQKLRLIILLTLILFAGSGYTIVRKTNPENITTPPATVHCVGIKANFECLATYFTLVTENFGTKVAFNTLKQQYTKKPEVVTQCHQLAHVIGNTAVDIYSGSITSAFQVGDSFCWSGYYHGVVEHAVDEQGEDVFIANANVLCETIPGKERYSFDYYNCVHGLGHGIMAVKEDELFQSLPLCDKLTGEWERKSCYGGVFMENVMVDNRNHFSKYLKKDDLMYPCNAVDMQYKEQCYLMQTSYALSQTNHDFAGIFKLCSNVEEEFRDTCAQSAGRDASGLSVSDVGRTVASCGFALDDRQEKNCIIGAVKDFISYFHGSEKAESLCAALPTRFRADCNETRVSYLKTL